jgi:hypothetical protein
MSSTSGTRSGQMTKWYSRPEAAKQPIIIDDYSITEGWSMVMELIKLLEPLEQASKRL